MPFVPSVLRACHHLPELSRMSRISPLANEISLGSSGEAESARRAGKECAVSESVRARESRTRHERRTRVEGARLEHRRVVFARRLAQQARLSPRMAPIDLEVMHADACRRPEARPRDAPRAALGRRVALVRDGAGRARHAHGGAGACAGRRAAAVRREARHGGRARREVLRGAEVKDGREPGVVGRGEVEDPENLRREDFEDQFAVLGRMLPWTLRRTSTKAIRIQPAPMAR